MLAFSKVGFHCGPAGNLSGIGDWMRRIDGAGIPFFLKSADHYGVLFEAVPIAANSGIPHTLVYRQSTGGQNMGYSFDVPDYFVEPEEAAADHWQHTRHNLPPEFDRERVWVEPINEIDKDRCDWLGRFAVHYAGLAVAEGYKITMFGWSSGEPERQGWETEGMLAYLRLCAERPDKLAVALHEYDFGIEGFEKVYPFHYGRFQLLFDVCDRQGIARPTVHLTEWGWSYRHVPTWEVARESILKAGEVYARFPEVKGTAIWNLGGGVEFGEIFNEAQRLIAPLADFTVSHRFTVADRPPGQAAPIDPALRQGHDGPPSGPLDDPERRPGPRPEPPARPGLLYIADVTIPDDSRIVAGSRFTKTWRVENNGDAAWRPDFRLAHAGGEAMTNNLRRPVPETAPGHQVLVAVDLVAPDQPGAYVSDWRLQDGQGVFFGDTLFTRIAVVRPPRPVAGRDNARFVADITIPDDSRLRTGASFTKIWRVENNGQRPWAPGYRLVFSKGEPMGNVLSFPLPAAEPGQQVEIAIPLTAPTKPGVHFSDWRLQDDQGQVFGDLVFLRILAVPAGGG